jgi:hypothetical protein
VTSSSETCHDACDVAKRFKSKLVATRSMLVLQEMLFARRHCSVFMAQ